MNYDSDKGGKCNLDKHPDGTDEKRAEGNLAVRRKIEREMEWKMEWKIEWKIGWKMEWNMEWKMEGNS